MDGSAVDFIIIPIVVVPCLAAWLIAVYRASTHPKTSRPAPTAIAEPDAIAAQAGPAHAVTGQVTVPRQMTGQAADRDLTVS